MKTFLGFTTGLLMGVLGGVFGMSLIVLTSDEVRTSMNSMAEDLKK